MDFLRQGIICWTGLIAAIGLLCLAVCGCAKQATVDTIPQATAEDKAQTEILRKRIAELKRQRPDVPDSVISMQAAREVQNGKSAPTR